MRYREKLVGRTLVAGLAASIVIAALVPPAGAWRYDRSYRSGWGGYSYDSWDQRVMQREAIAAQEEQRREVAREKRREEVGQKRETFQRDYLESQAAIRAASRAATRAPRDYFYRKPGSTMQTLPGGAVELKVGDTTFSYYSGIFFRRIPDKYIVVPSPFGAVVDSLPEGYRGAVYEGDVDTYFYYFGTFFAEENGKYKVVDPPAGTLVGYVPDGYTETEVDEAVRYQFGEISFRPAHWGNEVVYQVVKG